MDRAPDSPETVTGHAHVASVSFLASRAAPSAGFWIALAGGVAVARAAQRRGLRTGYAASLAAMLQTVAIMGPARLGIPLTQAANAPLLGRLEARGAGLAVQVAAAAAVRIALALASTAFFIWVILGGLDAYAGSYDAVLSRLPGVPNGTAAALALTAAGILGWGIFASVVQALVYRRGLRSWPARSAPPAAPAWAPVDRPETAGGPRRFDPRAVGAAAAVAFALLLASTNWRVLAAVAAWQVLAWLICPRDRDVVRTGLALGAVLAGGALVFGLVGGLGADLALRRAARAALLLAVATWMRCAAGEAGLRSVLRGWLRRMGRLPLAREAARILDELDSGRRLGAAGRSLVEALRGVERRPVPITDAVLAWVAREEAVART
jgi:hypothetical protein